MEWIKQLSYYIYAIDIQKAVLMIIVSICLWGIISSLFLRKIRMKHIWHSINIIVFMVSLVSILLLTVFSRNTTQEREICLIPCYTFYLALKSTEMYRTMLMNVLLFVPFGMAMPYILPKSCMRRIITTVLCALILSSIIEIVQYVLALGRAEVDDIICNTLGATIGCMSYWISKMIERKTNII